MKVIVAENYEEMSCLAADIVKEVVLNKPDAVLGLATGRSPEGLYRKLAEFCGEGIVSFKKVRTVNLDEYEGLTAENSNSYAYFMKEKLFSLTDIDAENTFIPDGGAADAEKECRRYACIAGSLQRDLQVLGLGRNGHIGFNEPFTPFDSLTHVVQLTDSTIAANAAMFGSADEVPQRAITMGIDEIMRADKILVLACGREKADAVFNTVRGEITEACPASILQKHPDVTLIADKEAAKLLF